MSEQNSSLSAPTIGNMAFGTNPWYLKKKLTYQFYCPLRPCLHKHRDPVLRWLSRDGRVCWLWIVVNVPEQMRRFLAVTKLGGGGRMAGETLNCDRLSWTVRTRHVARAWRINAEKVASFWKWTSCTRFEVQTAVLMIPIFWDVKSCRLVYRYQRFGGMICLHLRGSPRI
jgi:hypothetical protein